MRILLTINVILVTGLSLAACTPDAPADPGARYQAADAALIAAGRMKVDRRAPDVPLTPDLLSRHFEKVAFGEEFVLSDGEMVVPSDPSGDVLRRWAAPIRYALTGSVRSRDRRLVEELSRRLRSRTGLEITEVAGDADAPALRPNLRIAILGPAERAALARRYTDDDRRSVLADLFLEWTGTPDWPCAGEIYFSGPDSPRPYEIRLGVIYIRDEVRGLSRQACFEEEIAHSLGLTRDDPSVRPSIFNDDDEFALLTYHDELLVEILYDPRLAPGMDRATAMPIVDVVSREVLVE